MGRLGRSTAAVCVVSLGMVLGACGSGGESSNDDTSSATQASGAADTATVAQGAEEECRIGFSFGNTQSSIYINVVGYAREQAEARGCTLVEGAAGGDPARQLNEIQQWIQSDQVDAIVLVPIGGAVDPLIDQAAEAGIGVFGYASELPGGEAAILYDNLMSGEQLAEAAIAWAEENFEGRMSDFSYAIFKYDACGPPCKDRTDTIVRLMEERLGATPVATGDAIAEDTGLEQAEGMLQANPDLSMLLGINDAGALGALKAFEQAGKTGVFVGGMDGQLEALQAIAEGGDYKATSALRIADIGRAVADLPADYIQNGSAENVLVEPVLIDSPEAAQELIAESEG